MLSMGLDIALYVKGRAPRPQHAIPFLNVLFSRIAKSDRARMSGDRNPVGSLLCRHRTATSISNGVL